jgi:hypothetical protein
MSLGWAMTNPIYRDGIRSVQDPLSVIEVQQFQVPRGLAALPDTIDQKNAKTGPIQCVRNFLRKIYSDLISVVNTLKRFFCGYCLRMHSNLRNDPDEITNALAGFNNLRISGQINGIYITTNETNLESTRHLLERHPKRGQATIHIGCATWYNLDILCARKSTYGLIVDFNPKNVEFIKKTIELINFCESREVFKISMIQYLHSLRGTERDLFFHPDQLGLPTDRIERELSREGSWLQSEENYQYIKRGVVSKNRLIAITEDMRNCEKFSQIREFLNRKKIAIDTLYMSNICSFMHGSTDRNSFVLSIRQLLDRNSIFISCPKTKRPNGMYITLNQRAVLGEEVLADTYDVSKFFEEIQ